jgi:hypothetical protein
MQKLSVILLGLVTLWPVIYIFFFMAFMLTQFIAVPMGQYSGPASSFPVFLMSTFGIIFMLHILTMMIIFGLLIESSSIPWAFKPRDECSPWSPDACVGTKGLSGLFC